MFGTISITVNTFGQQQACTQRVSRGERGGPDPISCTNFRKNACLVCTLDRIFQVSQIKREDFKSHLTSPIEV